MRRHGKNLVRALGGGGEWLLDLLRSGEGAEGDYIFSSSCFHDSKERLVWGGDAVIAADSRSSGRTTRPHFTLAAVLLRTRRFFVQCEEVQSDTISQ